MVLRALSSSLIILLTLALCPLNAAELKRGVEIGDQSPSWSALPAADGQEYGLDSFGDAKAIAVVFTCNNCPVAVAYQDRLIALASEFTSR